ncbi:MAG: phytanoyl-CoA dioxygenase family protein [Gammaproteobacteria bacterium]|nr:phytanoyl-CoA dioxygenase family protein [Gammaproteobacteria bacterium]MBU1557020.1 phytanoyl-CoA dioxygenase family protein [Gammaproteobacteria bacterium]MBU2070949.1 phytanoyl-CoA dioxygenase family protein [Gammaproteobacteria bacterium]MBU2181543.1 phytanoyl-CoA dioxygenase family protein [Gammaproteobacteria bacterium]MBU2204879.1 phytanoyl-CoA dioxygenase family protein [Gammaproteobacteria bacterium]
MIKEFEENGYLVFKNFVKDSELQKLRDVATQFHQSWKQDNAQFYAEKAVNSAYLTAKKHLGNKERETLFKFIGSTKLMDVVTSIMGGRPTFMNTQLFFDPANEGQQNYWHRDPQYHMSIEEQKQALLGPKVVHFRIPLVDEPGVELIAGTHKRWDKDDELDVRLERNGRKNYENLSTGKAVKLDAGDLLIFSANMIHRGIYGMDRMSLDILFCDPVAELVKFVDESCLPPSDILDKLENADAFKSAIEIKINNKAMHATSA